MIRVYVAANSAAELAELEEAVRSHAALKLAGSSLGRTDLGRKLAGTRSDVLLEHAGPEDLEAIASPDSEAESLPRVWLVDEPEFGPAVALAQAGDSAVRAVLPAWATDGEIHAAIEAAARRLLVFHADVVDHRPAPGAPALGNAAARRDGKGSALSDNAAKDGVSAGQPLSPRESEILNLLAEGLGNKQIAARLGISGHTVKFHVTSIFNKLGASTRTEAVAIGIRRGSILL